MSQPRDCRTSTLPVWAGKGIEVGSQKGRRPAVQPANRRGKHATFD